jgi:hypothetical protein
MGKFLRIFVGTVVLAANSAWADGAAPITKIDARHLPQHVIAHRVTDQLFDMLVLPTPIKSARKPKHALTDLWYGTRPHGTYMPGLCETSWMRFTFDPVDTEDEGAETPVKVSGISAHKAYRFLSLPAAAPMPVNSAADRKALDIRCANLRPDDEFFEAPDEDHAFDAAEIMSAIVQQSQSGDVSRIYKCIWNSTPQACAKLISALRIEKLELVEGCNTPDESIVASCQNFTVGDLRLTVYYQSGVNFRLDQVIAHELIIIGDERED